MSEKTFKLTRRERDALTLAVAHIKDVLPLCPNDWQGVIGWSLSRAEAKVLIRAATAVLGDNAYATTSGEAS